MKLFSRKNKAPYKIKLVERIQYVGGSEKAQQDLQRLEERKQEFIEEAKKQLIKQSQDKIYDLKQFDGLLTDKEKNDIISNIEINPFIDVDKDIVIPYINIRQAIRRAHAY